MTVGEGDADDMQTHKDKKIGVFVESQRVRFFFALSAPAFPGSVSISADIGGGGFFI